MTPTNDGKGVIPLIVEKWSETESDPLHTSDPAGWLIETIKSLTVTSATPSEQRDNLTAGSQRKNARRILLEYLQSGNLRYVRRLWEQLDKEAPELYQHDELTDLVDQLQRDDDLRKRVVHHLTRLKM